MCHSSGGQVVAFSGARYVAETLDMEISALVALTLILGALVILVALAVGKRKEEIREETEQAAEFAGKLPVSLTLSVASL